MVRRSGSRFDFWLCLAVFLSMAAALMMTFLWAPKEQTMGDVQRIFYFHVPAGMAGMAAFAINFVASLLYLIRKDLKWDRLALAAAEVGVVFIAILLAFGMIWAKYAWYVWWTWSPRLTVSLILWMLYVAYLLLRNYVPEPVRRATVAAVFGVIAFVDVPVVWFSIRWWRDIHPQAMLEAGGLAPSMRPTLWLCAVAFFLLLAYVLRRRYFLETARDDITWLARRADEVGMERNLR